MATRNLEDELASGVINVLKQHGLISSQDVHATETEQILRLVEALLRFI